MKNSYTISRTELKRKRKASKCGHAFKSVQANKEVWALVVALLQKAEQKWTPTCVTWVQVDILYRKKVVIMCEKLWTYMRCYAESQMDEEDYAEALEKMLKLFEQCEWRSGHSEYSVILLCPL